MMDNVGNRTPPGPFMAGLSSHGNKGVDVQRVIQRDQVARIQRRQNGNLFPGNFHSIMRGY